MKIKKITKIQLQNKIKEIKKRLKIEVFRMERDFTQKLRDIARRCI